MADSGPAFDTNVLARPALRKLVGLWMEGAGCRTAVLPSVAGELTPVDALGRVRLASKCWTWALQDKNTYFHRVTLSPDQVERRDELLWRFPLCCFPVCQDIDELPNHPDAMIVAEAAAADADLLLTRDVRSMDHFRINEVVGKLSGRNRPLIAHVDDAINTAHSTAASGRELLVAALASVWPDEGGTLDLDDAHRRLSAMSEAIREGAAMTLTAERLMALFDLDDELEATLQRAADRAGQSNVLRLERVWKQWLRAGGSTEQPALTV